MQKLHVSSAIRLGHGQIATNLLIVSRTLGHTRGPGCQMGCHESNGRCFPVDETDSDATLVAHDAANARRLGIMHNIGDMGRDLVAYENE